MSSKYGMFFIIEIKIPLVIQSLLASCFFASDSDVRAEHASRCFQQLNLQTG